MGGRALECYRGDILQCMKRHERKPRMHQWRLLRQSDRKREREGKRQTYRKRDREKREEREKERVITCIIKNTSQYFCKIESSCE